jgi:hypothetical protein
MNINLYLYLLELNLFLVYNSIQKVSNDRTSILDDIYVGKGYVFDSVEESAGLN